MIQWFTSEGEAITLIQTFISWPPNRKQKQQFQPECKGLSLLSKIKQDFDADRLGYAVHHTDCSDFL